MPRSKKELSAEEIDYALSALDDAFGTSELLTSIAPIRFMTSGGTLAVKYFRVRETTQDVDCLTDPNVDSAREYQNEIAQKVLEVARALRLETDWFNDELKGFIQREKRLNLFLEAVEQNIVLFQGVNLVVYAARMEWQLERKIRRIDAGTNKRGEFKDIADAVSLIRFIKGGGPPLSLDYLRSLNFNGWETPVSLPAIEKVRNEYLRVYGEFGIEEQ
ncbi:hypothetical protein GGS24DRAFT_508167 [Hypoxylon argillaceum]|nr:hypothetical protein GGS24DRAFT_508167 [Hypoxylon argillaceum]